MKTLTAGWRSVIWREWRHCADPAYAQNLFELVSHDLVGWGARLSIALLNGLAGSALVILLGLLLTFNWAVLQHLVWAGGAVGATVGLLLGRRQTWKTWLDRLSSNTPVGDLGRLLPAAALIGVIGGMIFGPIFWLVALGLFWGVGDLINWINRGLITSPINRLDERKWWFWWRKRPDLTEVETALRQACADSAAAREIWNAPLKALDYQRSLSSSPEALVPLLLSNSWEDRFVARHSLVTLGSDAADALQPLIEHDHSPLKWAALWLVDNIARAPEPSAMDSSNIKNTEP